MKQDIFESYRNIIDPSQSALLDPKTNAYLWTATDFIIEFPRKSQGVAYLASPLPLLPLNKHRELGVAIEAVLTSALPMISELRERAVLLPGKVQAVIKAQVICLDPEEEYDGDWRCEGNEGDIIAVVLYCYHCSPGLEGGDLEFFSRRDHSSNDWNVFLRVLRIIPNTFECIMTEWP